jgi:hypothetical protein
VLGENLRLLEVRLYDPPRGLVSDAFPPVLTLATDEVGRPGREEVQLPPPPLSGEPEPTLDSEPIRLEDSCGELLELKPAETPADGLRVGARLHRLHGDRKPLIQLQRDRLALYGYEPLVDELL